MPGPSGGAQALPEARRGAGSAPPSYPTSLTPGAEQFGNQNLPPPTFDNTLPPPSQVYPDNNPPVPYVAPEPDEFGEAPDPYEGVDPQYIPNGAGQEGEFVPPPQVGEELQ